MSNLSHNNPPAPSVAHDEGHHLDAKSLRAVTGNTADFAELAKDCVAFANAAGGRLLIGIEDGQREPPVAQRIPPSLVDRVRKRLGELTVNVQISPEVRVEANGGEVLVVHVPRAMGVASTSDGRYFLRVGDASRPIIGDDVLRLATERSQAPWETLTGLQIPRESAASNEVAQLCARLRKSARVSPSVTAKIDDELLDHYGLADGEWLTNLGALLVGGVRSRRRLGTAPVVQALRFDDAGVRVGKRVWDDHERSLLSLIDEVWLELPDFRERYEIPSGLFRTSIPAYDEAVIRELLVNALVHRPYTQRGDIFLNLHPDRLEIVNPGRLPLGVTPANILHQSRRRNDGLARVLHDLELMEREGSGFDTIYERLLTTGRGAPEVIEGIDSVRVVVPRRVVHPGIIRLVADAEQRHQLSQRERITLGLLAQTEGLRSDELASRLGLVGGERLRAWLGRLLALGLVEQAGRTRGTRYFVPPEVLRGSGLDGRTTLRRVQPHRLRALILEDLERYPESASSQVHGRVGPEIPPRTFRRVLKELVDGGEVVAIGERRWRRYRVSEAIGQEGRGGR